MSLPLSPLLALSEANPPRVRTTLGLVREVMVLRSELLDPAPSHSVLSLLTPEPKKALRAKLHDRLTELGGHLVDAVLCGEFAELGPALLALQDRETRRMHAYGSPAEDDDADDDRSNDSCDDYDDYTEECSDEDLDDVLLEWRIGELERQLWDDVPTIDPTLSPDEIEYWELLERFAASERLARE